MAEPLVPCPACDRHVRITERACPFCAAALPADLDRRVPPPAPPRLGRAAAFAFGASLAVTACSDEVITAQQTGATTAGVGGAPTTSPSGGTGGVGGAPIDAGPDGDGGGTAVLYGPPPPPMDAGPDAFDGGGGEPLYGCPPPPPEGI